MNSIYIVRHGPLYIEKINVFPTSYTLDDSEEANRTVVSLNQTATDFCKYYAVVAANYQEAKDKVKEKVKK
jgi:hypothetical protein